MNVNINKIMKALQHAGRKSCLHVLTPRAAHRTLNAVPQFAVDLAVTAQETTERQVRVEWDGEFKWQVLDAQDHPCIYS